jgi:hypothetical protein
MAKEMSFDRFDPYWVPNRYPNPDPSLSGSWRTILNDGEVIGLIWTDFQEGVGITWITQTPEVVHLFTILQRMRTIHAPASAAYISATAAEDGHGSLGPEEFGPLSEAQAEYDKLHREVHDGAPS